MRSLLVSFALSLVACGGVASRDPADSIAEAGGGGRSVATTGGAGGKPTGSAGAPIVSLDDQPLLPLIAGRISRFVFSPIDPDKPMIDTCPEPTTSLESGEGLSFDGHVGTLYRTFCNDTPFLLEGQRDELTAHQIEAGELTRAYAYMREPVENGVMWNSGSGDQYTWQEAEPVHTPAGSFGSCWHRQGVDTRMTYCRGFGLVQALGEYGNYRLELVEKNF